MPCTIPNSRGVVVTLFIIAVIEGILLIASYTNNTATTEDSPQLRSGNGMVTVPVVNQLPSGGVEVLCSPKAKVDAAQNEIQKKDADESEEKEEEENYPDLPDYPGLTFDDLILGEHISSGARSIKLKVTLPDWWHEQHKNQRKLMAPQQKKNVFPVDKNMELIVKISNKPEWGNTEIQALRKLNENRKLAAEHNIMPIIWGGETFKNAFYAGEDGKKKPKKKVPKHLEVVQKSLRKPEKISALVVPNPAGLGQTYSMSSKLKTLNAVSHFMRSLLETLDYANSVGVNNNRLTNNNLRVDEDGKAILSDWSGMRLPGESIYGKDAAYSIVPPEGIPEEVLVHKSGNETIKKKVKQTSVSSYDIWSAGVQFANTIFQPCRWIYSGSVNKMYDLSYTIHKIGGNAKIMVNNSTDMSDLAELVGLNPEYVAGTTFRPPLCKGIEHPCQTCSYSRSYAVLESSSEQKRAQALGFLASMMYLAPQDRPTAKQLLGHPFLE